MGERGLASFLEDARSTLPPPRYMTLLGWLELSPEPRRRSARTKPDALAAGSRVLSPKLTRRSARTKPDALVVGSRVCATGATAGAVCSFAGRIVERLDNGASMIVQFDDGEVHTLPVNRLKIDAAGAAPNSLVPLPGSVLAPYAPPAAGAAPNSLVPLPGSVLAPYAPPATLVAPLLERKASADPANDAAEEPSTRRSARGVAGRAPPRLGVADDWGTTAASRWCDGAAVEPTPRLQTPRRGKRRRTPLAVLQSPEGVLAASTISLPMATPDAAATLLALKRGGGPEAP
jgi:hypothetical protein